MNSELKLELTEEEEQGVRKLISLCNREDGTNYDTNPEADFFYLSENPGQEETGLKESILSVLYGYRIGEREDGKEVLELSAFTHPYMRRQGLFRGNLNGLQDDFRNFRFHFLVKPGSDGDAFGQSSLGEDVLRTLQSIGGEHLGDELFMEKELESGIINPGDSLSNQFGEVHLSPYNEETLYLYGLLVYDRYLGKGYGRKIMESVEKAEKGPYRRILLQVSSQNKIAFSLYQKLDYRILERTSIYSLKN